MRLQDIGSVRGLLVTVMTALLLAGLLPGVAFAQAAPAVQFTFTGLDTLEPGVEGNVTVNTRVTSPGDLGDTEALRLVLTLTQAGQPMQNQQVVFAGAGGDVPTTTDAGGRLFVPPASLPPLTLGGDPALLAAGGLNTLLRLTLPAGAHALSAQLVTTGEQAAAVTRLAGTGRVQTAVEISRATFAPGVPVVFIATAGDFPDALTGGPAAARVGGPILLVNPDAIPDDTAAELRRLGPGRIVILGGTSVVSAAVAAQLGGFTTGSVDRLAGPTRFDTAAAIALAHFPEAFGTVFIATGLQFADALSGGAAAAFGSSPVLLVLPDAIPDATANTLRALSPGRIVILGGTGAVSAAVEAALREFTNGEITRFAGPDRFQTSAVVSQRTFSPEQVSVAFVATGGAFPDALSGVPAAGLFGAPLLLVTQGSVPAAVLAELQRLGLARIFLLGGTSAISAGVEQQLGGVVQSVAPSLGTATSQGAAGSQDFTVAPAEEPEPSVATVAITTPTQAAPLSVAPGAPFQITFTSDQAGSYALQRRIAGSGAEFVLFAGAQAGGDAAAGSTSATVTAPDTGTYDVRLVFANANGTTQAVQNAALNVLPPVAGPPAVSITSPTGAAPAVRFPGVSFPVTFTSDQAGNYLLQRRASGSDDPFTPLTGPEASGIAGAGSTTVTVNAPTDPASYDLRLVFESANGVSSFDRLGALIVNPPEVTVTAGAPESVRRNTSGTFSALVENPTDATIPRVRLDIAFDVPGGVCPDGDLADALEITSIDGDDDVADVNASLDCDEGVISGTLTPEPFTLQPGAAGGAAIASSRDHDFTVVFLTGTPAGLSTFTLAAVQLDEDGEIDSVLDTDAVEFGITTVPEFIPAALFLEDLNDPDVTGIQRVGIDSEIKAVVSDRLGRPVAGVDVRFEVLRDDDPVPAISLRGVTDALGEAFFTYTSVDPASDLVRACVSLDGALLEDCSEADTVTFPPAAPGTLATRDRSQGVLAPTLAEALTGRGVEVVDGSAAHDGALTAAGLFNGGVGIIELPRGVVLSTGRVADVRGPNNALNRSTQHNQDCIPAGDDPDLGTLVSGRKLCDESVLGFDFVPDQAAIVFQFVFASEEYEQFVGSQFSDVFGLFVNGENCATVGDDELPITINTINHLDNSDLYVPNLPVGDAPFNTQMNGFTVVLTCAVEVTPNEANSVKLAIADVEDAIIDSAVFIGAISTVVSDQLETTWLPHDGQITGQVRDSLSLDPVEGATVRVFDGATEVACTKDVDGAEVSCPTTGPDGSFSLDVLPGTYRVDISKDLFATLSIPDVVVETEEETPLGVLDLVRTPPGDPATLLLELIPDPGIFDADGNPERADISGDPVRASTAGTVTARVTVLDDDGRGVDPDRWRVRFEVYEDPTPDDEDAPHVGDDGEPVFTGVLRTPDLLTGQADFTFTFDPTVGGGRLDGKDLVVACMVLASAPATQCIDGVTVEYEEISHEPSNFNFPTDDRGRMYQYDRARWEIPVADSLTIDDDHRDRRNLSGFDRDVRVEVLDQFGVGFHDLPLRVVVFEPKDATTAGGHQVYRPLTTSLGDTDGDGILDFTYSHPNLASPLTHFIVVCTADDGPCVTDEFDADPNVESGDLVVDGGAPQNLADAGGRLLDWTTTVWLRISKDTGAFLLHWAGVLDGVPGLGAISDDAAAGDPTGSARLLWNANNGLVCWELTYTGPGEVPAEPLDEELISNAHVHAGAHRANGPIALQLGNPAAVEGMPGLFESAGCRDVTGDELDALGAMETALNAAEPMDLVDYYVNIHTVANRHGEVRGQLGRMRPAADADHGFDPDLPDGGFNDLPPAFRMAIVPMNVASPQRLDLTFSRPVHTEFNLEPTDFTVTVNDEPVGVLLPQAQWSTFSTTQRIDLATPVAHGDVVAVTINDGAATKIIDEHDRDLATSVRTRTFTARSIVAVLEIANQIAAPPSADPDDPKVMAGAAIRFQNAANEPRNVQVRVKDQFGNLLEGIEVHAQVEAGPPGGTLRPLPVVTAVTDAQGIATFDPMGVSDDLPPSAWTRLRIEQAGLGYVLGFCADRGTGDGASLCDSSDEFRVVPAPVSRLFINPDGDLDADDQPQTIVTAGQPIRDRNGDDLTVTAEDEFGNRIEGLGVSAAAVDNPPGALVTNSVVSTDADGVATFPAAGLVIQTAGEYRLRFRALGSDPVVQVHSAGLTVTPDVPASLVIDNAVSGPADDVVAGTHIQFSNLSNDPEDPRILVRDQFDNPVPGLTVVATADPDELEDAPEAVTGTDGVAVFTDDPGSRLEIQTAAPGYTLTFAAQGSPDPALSATSNAFTVVPAGVDAGNSTAEGTQVDTDAIRFEFQIADEFGNPITGLGPDDFTASVNGSAPVNLDSGGFQEFTEHPADPGDPDAIPPVPPTPHHYTVFFRPVVVGVHNFVFTAQGHVGPAVEFDDIDVDVEPAIATTLELVDDDQPTQTVAGEHIVGSDGNLRVRVLDQFGNNYAPPVTVSAEVVQVIGAGVLEGTPQATTDDSVATFTSAPASRLEIQTAGTYRLVFDAPTTDPLETDEFDVVPAAPTTVALQIQPDETRAGEHVLDGDGDPLVVRVTDTFGNGVPGITVEASATGPGALEDNEDAEAPNAETSASADPDEVGYATFVDDGTSTLILQTAGTYTLTFSAAGVGDDTSEEFEVVANDPTTVLLLNNPADTQAGEHVEANPTPLAVLVTDMSGNGVNGVTVRASVIGGTNGAAPGPLEPASDDGEGNTAPRATTATAAHPDTAEPTPGIALFEDADPSRLELRTAGLYRLVFTADDVDTTETSTAFEITAGPAFAGTLAGTPTGGGETTLEISVEDQFGNPISGLALTDFTLHVGDAVASDCTGVDGPTVVFPDGRFDGFVDNGDGTYTLVFQETPGEYCFDIAVDGTEIVTDQLIVVEEPAVGSIALLNQPRAMVQAGEHVTTSTGQNLRVRVRDQFNNPLAGVTVEATAQEGPGALDDTPQAAVTDGNGIATFIDAPDSRLVIDDPGEYRIRFAANGFSVDTNQFTVFAPEVTAPTVASPSLAGSDLEAAGGGPLVVTVTDGTDPLAGVEVTASLASGPGALSGTLTETTDVDGEAAFADLQVDAPGVYTLDFTAGTVSETTAPFDVFSLEEPTVANPSFVDSDLQASSPLVVTVRDSAGGLVAGANVDVELVRVSETGATDFSEGTTTQSTDGDGEAVFDDLQIPQVGEYALRFSVQTVSGSRVTNTFEVWEVTVIDVADPSLADSDLEADGGGPLTVTVIGADGAGVVGQTVTVALESGSGALSGTTTQDTDGDGVATFADLQVDAADTYQLAFTVAGVDFLTNEFDVWSATVDDVADPSFTDVDLQAASPVTVTVRDETGTLVEGVDVQVALVRVSETGATAFNLGSTTTQTTAVDPDPDPGVAVFDDLQIGQVGEYALAFSVAGVSGSRPTNTFEVWEVAVTDVADPSPAGSDLEAEGGGPLTVTVIGADGDPVADELVTVALASGPGTLSRSGAGPFEELTDGDGVATFADLQVDDAGDYRLAFTVAGVAFLTNEFEVTL